MKLVWHGTQPVLHLDGGGMMWLTTSQLKEFQATGNVTPFRDERDAPLTGPLEGLRRDGDRLVKVEMPGWWR